MIIYRGHPNIFFDKLLAIGVGHGIKATIKNILVHKQNRKRIDSQTHYSYNAYTPLEIFFKRMDERFLRFVLVDRMIP